MKKAKNEWTEEHRNAYLYGVLAAAQVARCFPKDPQKNILRKFNITKSVERRLRSWIDKKHETRI